jgi:hypothetical protein
LIVDEFRALSESMPRSGKGSAWRISSSAAQMARWVLPCTARVSTQVVWMSVRLSEKRQSGSPSAPVWATRAISVKPGVVTSHRSVRSGMVLEQRAGLGAAVETPPERLPALAQDPVHRPRAHGLQVPEGVRAEGEALRGPGEPQRQHGFEAVGPRVPGRVPQRAEGNPDRRRVEGRSTAAVLERGHRRVIERADGAFPRVAARGAELIQDRVLEGA